MKRYLSYLLIFTMCLFATTGPIIAETIDEVQGKRDQLQAERDKKLEELRNKQMNLAEIVNQTAEVHEQKVQLESEKANIQGQITNIQGQIEETKTRIETLRDRAGAALVFYQKVDDTNPLVQQLFGPKGEGQMGSSSYEEMQATDSIMDAGMEAITEAVSLQTELTNQQAQLEVKKVELDTKITDISAKEQELEVLKVKVQQQEHAAKEEYDAAQSANLANQKLQSLMEQAGCQPGEVYGVDCGQVQSTGALARPVSYGMITMEYMGYENHTGIDIGQNGSGGPVFAAGPGQVVAAGNGIVWGGGNQVLIVHNVNGQQIITSYCHMSSISVREGQTVDTSTQIGTVGLTGNAFGPHLHFEISSGAYGWSIGGSARGSWINPRNYVNFPPTGVWFNGR